MARILAISDIHGHTEGVKRLLDAAGYAPGADQLYLLGDFIDTNPNTWQALDFIKQLTLEGAYAVPGNLERWLCAQKEIQPSLDESVFNFINSLPYYYEHADYLLVHAGFRPGVELKNQLPKDFTEIRQTFWGTPYPFSKTVVFGHTPTNQLGAAPGEIWAGPGLLGIDTGAKHNLRLSLVDLSTYRVYSCSTDKQRIYGDLRAEKWPDQDGQYNQ